jgi:hypothetical protein
MLGVEFTDLRQASPFFRFGIRQGFLSLIVASYLLHHHQIRLLAPLTTLLKGNPGKKRQAILRIQPAAVITEAECDRILAALDEVCTIIAHNQEESWSGTCSAPLPTRTCAATRRWCRWSARSAVLARSSMPASALWSTRHGRRN